MQFTLYTTLGCHLCEHAKAVIARVLADRSYTLAEIDIAESAALTEQYGVRIPVVAFNNNAQHELGWPFDEQQFTAWLNDAQ